MPIRPARRVARLLLAATCVALPVRAAQAQATVTADASGLSQFVWRGVTFTSRPVVQADAMLTAPVRHGALTAGLWGNLEPASYNDGHQVSLLAAGEHGPALTFWTPWLEWAGTAHRATVTAGAIGYFMPGITGLASVYNTGEAYLKIAVAAPLAPRVAVYQDVAKVHGGYAEAGIAPVVRLGGHALTLGALAEVSLAQARTRDPGKTYYFARNGLAAVDLSAATTVAAGPLQLQPNVHWSLGRDPLARVVTLDRSSGSKVAVGLTATWSRALHAAPSR